MNYQTRWRITCSVALACAALMAWYGAGHEFMTETPLGCVVYWGAFLLCLVVCFVCVALDIRFVRLQYALERREIVRQTLGDEEFRRALIEAQKKKRAEGD